MKVKISIIIPTYNGHSRGYLLEAIESAIGQTYDDFELILVDDGSTDETGTVCKQFASSENITYTYQDNKGLSAARNTGIRLAKGDYLLFLDDDDLYEPQMVERMVETFLSNSDPKIGMLYCAYAFIDERGEPFGRWYIPANGDIYSRLFYDNYAGSPSGTMVRRSVFEKVGLFDEELKSCEDYDMWLRIAKHYHVYSVDETLLRYRIHRNNMSGNIPKIEHHQKKVLEAALEDSPVAIKSKREDYFHHVNLEFASKYFEAGDYPNFRRCCRESHRYKSVGTKWRLKVFLSYLPRLTRTLHHYRRGPRFPPMASN